mmetsp:Transcript_24300/g.54679  ORF Transcript_24300/g.54679 Transcript_24300/m.54679 type:complete len:212 (-) Transcript_24300:1312-1947(-)
MLSGGMQLIAYPLSSSSFEVEERKNAVDVDDAHLRAVAVDREHLRTAAEDVLGFHLYVRQRVSLNCPTLSSNKQHVSVRTDTGYGILRILLPSQLVKSTSVGTWAFIHMPDDLLAIFLLQRNSVLGRVDRGQLRHPRAVLPDADGVVVRADDVRLCHVDVLRLDVDVLGIHRRPDGVAEDENVYPNFVCPRCKDTEVAMGSDARQGLDELD